jgi:hypothetical protein
MKNDVARPIGQFLAVLVVAVLAFVVWFFDLPVWDLPPLILLTVLVAVAGLIAVVTIKLMKRFS